MFITVGNIAYYTHQKTASWYLSRGKARVSTAKEAANCVSRYVYSGNPRMVEANDEFEKLYSIKRRIPTNPQTYIDQGNPL